MQPPREKPFDPAVPPQFLGAVHDRLRRCDGRRVGATRPCPACGASDHRKNGYQRAGKTFARLVTEEGFEDVSFEVQQYECKACGRSFQGDLAAYFYDDCAYGKPIVDLCLFHAADTPYQAVERLLRRRYGVQVDRDTVERYDALVDDASTQGEAVVIDGRRFSLPFLSYLFGENLTDSPAVALSSHRALW